MTEIPDSMKADEAHLAEALKAGLRPILIHWDEPGAAVVDSHTGSMVVYVDAIPRSGDLVRIDGLTMLVDQIVFSCTRTGDSKLPLLRPSVYATLQD